jgi:hypothetical protein
VFLRLPAGNPGDITDGARALVTVASSRGALTATTVMIPPDVVVTGTGAEEILGLVADASAAGFTLVEPDGRRDQVTVTPATTVITPVHVGESQLELGVATVATGVPGAGGTVAANTVEQFPVPAAIPPLYTSG